MPKMKTKSSAKKRFKVTATGKVVAGQAGKRHGMIKRTTKFIRDARGTTVLSKADALFKAFNLVTDPIGARTNDNGQKQPDNCYGAGHFAPPCAAAG